MNQNKRAADLIKNFCRNYHFILIFLAFLLLFLAVNQGGTTLTTLMNIPRHSTVVGMIALGMGLIILIGDIDLSVGSQLALIGGFTVMIFNSTGSILLSLFFSLALGALLGFLNGFLVGAVKMPAFIVTLAAMLIFRSTAQTVMNSQGLTIYQLDSKLSQWQPFWQIGNESFLQIPIVVWILIVTVAILTFLTTSMKFGKKIYAIGGNEKAARLSGIHVEGSRILVYMIAGTLVGLASFLYLANSGSVDPATSGKNYELYAIAGVVISGIHMSGGKGRVLGIIFGSMTFTIIDKIINTLGLNPLMNDTIKGVILLLAILIQMLPGMLQKLRGQSQAAAHSKAAGGQ